MPENSISEKAHFHWSLADQSDSEVNGKQIRVHHFEPHTAGHVLANSFFIGFRLTNQISHAIKVRFGCAMSDNLQLVDQRAKICTLGSIQKMDRFEPRGNNQLKR